MKLQATRGKYLVEILKEKRVSAGGIILAKTQKEIAYRGKVVSVGLPTIEKKKELPLVAKIGDIIHFKKYSGKPFWIDRRPYLALKRDNILAANDENSIWAVRNTLLIELKYADKIGSIILPDQAKQYSGDFHGLIISIGEEVSFKDKVVKGDKVFFERHEGFFVGHELRDYLSMRERWVTSKEVKIERR